MNEPLHTKYRPRFFSEVIGHGTVIKAMYKYFERDEIPTGILFTGMTGIGKTTFARLIARRLNCTNVWNEVSNFDENGDKVSVKIFEPCGECNSCLAIDKNNHPDVIEMDAASNSGVDNIRELLSITQYYPSMGLYTIIIIDEAQRLSVSAFDALLKTLEEPNDNVRFILCSTEAYKIPANIKSRCVHFMLLPLNNTYLGYFLDKITEKEEVEIQDDSHREIIANSYGSPRIALQLLSQYVMSGATTPEEVRRMAGAVSTASLDTFFEGLFNEADDVLKMARHISKKGNIQETMESMVEWILKSDFSTAEKQVCNEIISEAINSLHHWNDKKLCFGKMTVKLMSIQPKIMLGRTIENILK